MKRVPRIGRRAQTIVAGLLLVVLSIAPTGCFVDEIYQPYYGRVVVRSRQDFRWIDGGLPQTFDPAFAAAPPDTDLVRAIFEGLTDYDPRTLAPVPAVATRWETSDEGRTWTFHLREDARWSNGEAVTAKDFVDSWQRTVKIGDLAPHTNLLSNIQGARTVSAAERPSTNGKRARQDQESSAAVNSRPDSRRLGVEAVSDRQLRVHLQSPDLNFPALVAHPVFRPVKLTDEDTLQRIGPLGLVSNGAFMLAKSEADRVLLERAANYWDKNEVNLESVEFVGAKNSEAALTAYRAGEVDAVTNSAFEPLALKLLAPYKDFRRDTYGALTYYNFNLLHEPFDDVRVREALAIAIDRDRLSQDELGGATEPAKKFLPDAMSGSKVVVAKAELLEKDIERARKLLAEAGFPDGDGFPTVKLLINRNEQQRLVAQSIASMWRSVLNIETEITIKPWDEYEAAIRVGDYDIVRRGMVMQTTDELTNIRALFQQDSQSAESGATGQTAGSANSSTVAIGERSADKKTPTQHLIQSETEALNELRAIPLYFASSYALVKPYVSGFDSNVLDMPSLKHVRIDTNWREPMPSGLNPLR
ncbi:MAG: peptide ABC transporter substrate-binding protein [Pyrinomonadaceae bacterium]|nr:peptide ABC transporter substrate-binding protein [Pyrinomonadaceae bacterium]MBA3567929.1 peptide ABC transporter substrate-binding protein [Pyrinomonadaceae bacterium]MBA3571362.1 peptide ABC transporter substrate-binding protein [Pyrinomonadaceae bacterium]